MFYPAWREPAFVSSGWALLGPRGQDASARALLERAVEALSNGLGVEHALTKQAQAMRRDTVSYTRAPERKPDGTEPAS